MKKRYFLTGIISGITALTCCIAPVILVLLGGGTSIAMMIMHQFHTASIVSSLLLMSLISLYIIKKKEGICNLKTIKKNYKGILVSLVIMILTFLVINYLVVAPIAGIVYSKLKVTKVEEGNETKSSQFQKINITPENKGIKIIKLKVEGIYCGSCGPAIEYDLKNLQGTIDVERTSTNVFTIKYNSSRISKEIITSKIHDPYVVQIIYEKCIIQNKESDCK